MSRINLFICYLFIFIGLTSCSDNNNNNAALWGETDYYSNFPFGLYDYEPVRMTKTLCFEINDVMENKEWDVEFGLFKKDCNGSYIPVTDEVVIYKNGQLCPNNIFTVKSGEKEVDLGIEFSSTAAEGAHKWYLKVLNNQCFDRINEFSTDDDVSPLLLEMMAKKRNIPNPLSLGLVLSLIVIFILLLLWLCILKPIIYPTFKIGNIQLIGKEYYSNKRIHGARKLVVTSLNNKKQSLLSKFFTGKIIYECNDIWIDGWELYPNGKKARLSTKRKYIIDPIVSSLEKQVDYTIEHMENGMKVKVTLM